MNSSRCDARLFLSSLILGIMAFGAFACGEPSAVNRCEDIVCESSPPVSCDGNDVVINEAEGTCDDLGVCNYEVASRETCSGETPYCRDGECVGEDPCADVTCDPPDVPEPCCDVVRYSLEDAIRGLPFTVNTPIPPQVEAEQVVTPATLGSHINTSGMRLILEPGDYGNHTVNSQDQQIILREGVYFGSLSIGGSARRISIRNEVPRSGNMTNITTPEGGSGGFPEDILIDGIRSDAGANRNFIHGQRIAIINSFIRTVDFPLSSFNAPPTGYNDIIIANCYLENYGGTLGEEVHLNQAGVRFHNTNRLVFVDNRVNKLGGTKHTFRLHGGDGADIDYAYIGRNVHSGPGADQISSAGTAAPAADILRNIWYVDNWLSHTNPTYGAMLMVSTVQGFLTHLTMRGNTYRGPTPAAVHTYDIGPLPNEPGWIIEDNDLQSPYQEPAAWEFK